MGDVNYYLKKPNAKGLSLIYLQFRYNGSYKLTYSFGQLIDQRNWSATKQRVKNNFQSTSDGKQYLNELLTNLATCCLQAYNKEIKYGIPLPATLKGYLDNFMNQQKDADDRRKEEQAEQERTKKEGPSLYKLIDRFINNEITFKGKKKSPNTIKTYVTTLGHLREFENQYKYPIDFETITLDFYYKYMDFLSKKKNILKDGTEQYLSQNAIGKDIQILKVFMSEAVDLGYTNNMQFKHKKFIVSREDPDAVYLTTEEIMKLYRHDFKPNSKYEQVRDLFVFGCLVGLRYSDYSNVKPEHLVTIDDELFIKMRTQKTGELVIIPTNPVVQDIFDKYQQNPNRLPRAYSNQKFNQYIKEVCKEAGLHEVGRNSDKTKLKLFENISSHTARRSFATNYYLEGFPVLDLMKITGHRTEKAFLRYIKVSKLDSAIRLRDHNKKKNWSMYLLKMAS